MKTTEEKISVMQAYTNGTKIQFQQFKKGEWLDWTYSDEPIWDWHTNDYRIKPESLTKKIVPYDSAEEFLQAQKEHGVFVKNQHGNFLLPMLANINGVHIYSVGYLFFKDCAKQLTWQDGSPCGKEVEV